MRTNILNFILIKLAICYTVQVSLWSVFSPVQEWKYKLQDELNSNFLLEIITENEIDNLFGNSFSISTFDSADFDTLIENVQIGSR